MSDSPKPPAADHLQTVSVLGEPNRRALYEYVVEKGDWVGRDEAADALDIKRGIAAHHLDRLADEGLLEVERRRLTGRTGPGAGRPAKLYRRASRDFAVALPPREYQLAGQLLAEAVENAQQAGNDITTSVEAVSRAHGRRLGEVMKKRMGRRRSTKAALATAMAVLAEHGFEPAVAEDGTVELRNCPFHALSRSHTDLICGMNDCLIKAALEELGTDGLEARLQPDPELCCVRIHLS